MCIRDSWHSVFTTAYVFKQLVDVVSFKWIEASRYVVTDKHANSPITNISRMFIQQPDGTQYTIHYTVHASTMPHWNDTHNVMCIIQKFPALCHNWFSQLHFSFFTSTDYWTINRYEKVSQKISGFFTLSVLIFYFLVLCGRLSWHRQFLSA